MKTIHKYALRFIDTQSVIMPVGAKVLAVQNQNDKITMWAEVDDINDKEQRVFSIFGTGCEITGFERHYIGTVQIGDFVWHIYEQGI